MMGSIEFGDIENEILIIEKANYGSKSSGAAFRAFLEQTFNKIGFTASIADPDIWMRPATKSDNEE